jgi:hypothetical protein
MALSLVTPTIGATSDPVLTGLANTLSMSRPLTRELNDYYEGDHRLKMLGLAVPPELEMFNVPLAWPRLTVDALEQRLDVTGFRFPEQPADSYLWENWQFNNMDERQTFVHTDALALGRSYVCVGTNPDDQRASDRDGGVADGDVRGAGSADASGDGRVASVRRESLIPGQDDPATLYLPNVTRWLVMDDGRWVDEVDPDFHNLGVPAGGAVREPVSGDEADGVGR